MHTLVFSPDQVSTSYLMTDLARRLQHRGHRVTVLTTTPHYNVPADAAARQPMTRRWFGLLYRSELEGIQVWHCSMPLKGSRGMSRAFDHLRFHILSLLAAIRTVGAQDIVIAPSPPLTMGIIAWLMGKRFRAPSVYNVQEMYPDFAVNQGAISNPAFIRLMKWIERAVYAKIDLLVPISEWFARAIRARGVAPDKIRVIPNFVDVDLYKPLPRDNELAREFGLASSFVVLYAGNVGLSQDWESFLHAAQVTDDLPVTFVVAGDGVRYEWLTAEVARRGLSNVRLLGYQPRTLMPLLNASCDLGTIPMRTATSSDTFPSKIYTIFACGRAALVSADPDSELEWVVRTAAAGRVVRPDDPDAYAAAVRRAFEERELLPAEGQRGRAFVERDYSAEAVAGAYDRLILDLTGG